MTIVIKTNLIHNNKDYRYLALLLRQDEAIRNNKYSRYEKKAEQWIKKLTRKLKGTERTIKEISQRKKIGQQEK